MSKQERKARYAPVVAFALVLIGGWIATFVLANPLIPCLGLLAAIIAGDITAAIFHIPEPPPRKRIGKPR